MGVYDAVARAATLTSDVSMPSECRCATTTAPFSSSPTRETIVTLRPRRARFSATLRATPAKSVVTFRGFDVPGMSGAFSTPWRSMCAPPMQAMRQAVFTATPPLSPPPARTSSAGHGNTYGTRWCRNCGEPCDTMSQTGVDPNAEQNALCGCGRERGHPDRRFHSGNWCGCNAREARQGELRARCAVEASQGRQNHPRYRGYAPLAG